MDKSNGYEAIAAQFITSRGLSIGVASVRHWAKTLPLQATVLDLGCGTGVPISKALMDEGMRLYGIDAAPALVETFRLNFPHTPVACEAVEDSSFFRRQFDAIVAWGLLFLLPIDVQDIVLQKAATALLTGGKLLFTAPAQAVSWLDALTAQASVSLGAQTYHERLAAYGFLLIEEFDDEGGNHYYHAIKS